MIGSVPKIMTSFSLALKFSAFAFSSAFFLGTVYNEVGRFIHTRDVELSAFTVFLCCMLWSGWLLYEEVAVRVREKRLLELIEHNCNPNYVVKDIVNLDQGNILATYENVGTGHKYKRQISL